MKQPALLISGLGKSFRKYHSEWHRILSWFGVLQNSFVENWILHDLSFSIAPGESVGIIGKNGAGKSTLLKLITGTLRATRGKIQTNGVIAAILELGMGFVPEFTGRENIFLAASLLGFSRAETAQMIPSIEAFAEIGDYFDQPIRTYSSGMEVRLAFSLATAFRPDILIIDEALSVGDAYFQCKSFEKIREFQRAGVTLVFVSHDACSVKTLCNRAILLDQGSMIKDDRPDIVLDYYNAMIAKKEKDRAILQQASINGAMQTRSGNHLAHIDHVELTNHQDKPTRAFQVGEEAKIICKISFKQEIDSPTIGILIRDHRGNDVFGTNNFYSNPINKVIKKGEHLEAIFSLPMNLGLGNYSLTVAIHSHTSHLANNFDWWDRALVFQVVPGTHDPFIGVAYLSSTVLIREGCNVRS